MPARRDILFGLAALTVHSHPLWAAPNVYNLDQTRTRVGFHFQLNGIWQRGSIPVSNALISLDLNRLQDSEIEVTLDARASRTGLIFATQAMTGPQVLDVQRFPSISFKSRRILLGPGRRLSGGAQIQGDLTLRGVTRPISLKAALYRPAGTAPNDLDQLDFTLSGRLSRSAFGASGFSGLVRDEVQLEIRAGIQRMR